MMEEIWTNRVRQRKERYIPEARLFASIVYHTVVAENWELQRIIFCLAFDEKALIKVKNYTPQKSPPYALKNAKRFGKSNTEALISALKNQSIQQNLASALASTRQELYKSAGASDSNPCPSFEFVDATYIPNRWSEKKTYELIDRIYRWCGKNSEEPKEPFLRVSHQWNSLTSGSTGSTVASYFPDCVHTTDEQYVLVAQSRSYSRRQLRIYVIPGLTDATERLQTTLRDAAGIDVLYKYSLSSDISNNWKDVYKKWRTTDSENCKEFIKEFQQWKDAMQDRAPPSLPVALPAIEKTEPQHVERPPLPPQAWTSYPPSSVSITEAKINLKRPREDADENDILTIQKKAKNQIIIIDG
ncbi:hypothetical protein BGZ60DRAFT_551610 [Tricladium varicosporioides]|nr:hypothetical protein BGZ60DRAFT_551610 [Hymenoscyphus varicosporioides]